MALKGAIPWSEFCKQFPRPKNLKTRVAKKLREMISRGGPALDLRSLRRGLGKTQQQIAAAMDMDQSRLSRLERRTDHKVSTIARYVKALGGELEISAVFGDKRIKLRNI